MRTSLRTKITVAVAVAVGAVAAYSVPSQAQAQSPSGGHASGCYKIVEGVAGLTRHIDVKTGVPMDASFWHEADVEEPLGMHEHSATISNGYKRTDTHDADVSVSVLIDNALGNDCSDVRYRLRVLDEQSRLVTEVIVPGGASDTVTWYSRFAYPGDEGRFAYVSVTSETLQGRVVDTAPDAAPGLQVNLTDGGATSSFN